MPHRHNNTDMSEKDTKPERLWAGEYGEEWTSDNDSDIAEVDAMYRKQFGISRTDLVDRFLGDVDRDARILEVGANIGTQLRFLEEMGFTRLYGIDIQRKAIERAHRRRPQLDIVEGNLFDIPFKDGFFDLVFTSGVLIHVPPEKLDAALDEIVRCSRDLIYGHEYYADDYTEITHRGHDNVLWKTDFPARYRNGRSLETVDVEYLTYADSDNVDVEFLLRLD